MRVVFVILSFLLCSSVYAQRDIDTTRINVRPENFKAHSISGIVAASFITEKTTIGEQLTLAPVIGVNYAHWFNVNWGLGATVDLELREYEVKINETKTLQRSYPVNTTFQLFASIFPKVMIGIGPGLHIDKEITLWTYRIQVLYKAKINDNWALAPTIYYDNKEGEFDSWSAGIILARLK